MTRKEGREGHRSCAGAVRSRRTSRKDHSGRMTRRVTAKARF